MANFKMSIHTERGNEVARYGNKETSVHAATWNHGFKTVCEKVTEDIIKISVFKTGGSKEPMSQKLVYEEYINENQEVVVV